MLGIFHFRYLQYFGARVLNTKALECKGYHTDSWIKKTSLLISKLIISNKIKSFLLHFVRRFNHYDTSLVGHYFGKPL